MMQAVGGSACFTSELGKVHITTMTQTVGGSACLYHLLLTVHSMHYYNDTPSVAGPGMER